MTYLDHAEGRDGIYAYATVEWEAVLPGYSDDSGSTGTREAHVDGLVIDGEIESFRAIDAHTGEAIDLPGDVEAKADRLLLEYAARYGA